MDDKTTLPNFPPATGFVELRMCNIEAACFWKDHGWYAFDSDGKWTKVKDPVALAALHTLMQVLQRDRR